MRHFLLLGSVLACLCGGAVAASAQLLTTHAGVGALGGGGGGAIAFVGAADLGNATATSLTHAYTAGSGTNELLVVSVIGDVPGGSDDCSGGGHGVTYNGVSMTLRQKNVAGSGSARFIYLFELLAPASGSHNVVVTCGSSHFIGAVAADYSGVVANDANGTGQAATATQVTVPITVGASNAWVIVTMVVDYTLGTAYQSCCSSTVALTQRVLDSAYHINGILDSNGTVSAGSQSVIVGLSHGSGSQDFAGIAASFHP